LELVQKYFGVGNIYKNGEDRVQLLVETPRDLTNVIIPHFDNFPLITQKFADFKLFKQVVEIIKRKEHLTTDGVQKIVNIRASMNRGCLSDELKQAFSNSIFVPRALVADQVINSPY